MSDIRKLLEAIDRFYFAGEPEQKPGDQVRGHEISGKTKKRQHPFHGRLVGAGESILKELERELAKSDINDSRNLMREYREFVKEYEGQQAQSTNNTKSSNQKTQQDLTAILKSAQNLQLPDSQKVALALTRTQTDPKAKLTPAEAQKIGQSVAPLIAPALAHPGTASQLSSVLKKAETMAKTQPKTATTQASTNLQSQTTTAQVTKS